MVSSPSSPLAAWRTEHEYFRRLLTLLQREVDVFHGGERPDYELMLDILNYLREYGDAFHHPREDVAFARLIERRPEMALPIARLRQEHRVIARAGERLVELLDEALDDAVLSRAEVEVAAATYLVFYGNHIDKEEETVLGAAEKALTREDWQAVRDAVSPPPDPLFGVPPQERYRQLARRLAS
jgi:hemerythrin-like domain-containing protein